MKKIKSELLTLGFTQIGEMSTSQIEPLEEIRNMCAVDRCGAYGRRWSCPPYCGTLEECKEKLNSYEQAIILTTAIQLEDSYDIEGMNAGNELHNEQLIKAVEMLAETLDEILPLGAGGCRICEVCTCPDEPCRFPEKLVVPMEAYDLYVSDICEKSKVKYYNGEATVTYISAILMKDKGEEICP